MDILVSVTNQQLRLESQIKKLIYGTKDFIRLVFSLTGDWDGLRVCAQFSQGQNVYNEYLDADNSVYFPSEIQPGTCFLILYGTDGERKRRAHFDHLHGNEKRAAHLLRQVVHPLGGSRAGLLTQCADQHRLTSKRRFGPRS